MANSRITETIEGYLTIHHDGDEILAVKPVHCFPNGKFGIPRRFSRVLRIHKDLIILYNMDQTIAIIGNSPIGGCKHPTGLPVYDERGHLHAWYIEKIHDHVIHFKDMNGPVRHEMPYKCGYDENPCDDEQTKIYCRPYTS